MINPIKNGNFTLTVVGNPPYTEAFSSGANGEFNKELKLCKYKIGNYRLILM